jgi:hypothetical protein
VDSGQQRDQLAQIVLQEDLELAEVWICYFSIGGTADEEQVARYAVGELELPQLQRDLISIALREAVDGHRKAMGESITRERPRRFSDHGE